MASVSGASFEAASALFRQPIIMVPALSSAVCWLSSRAISCRLCSARLSRAWERSSRAAVGAKSRFSELISERMAVLRAFS